MLRNQEVSIDDLLLDPNNPRFKQDLSEDEHVPDNKLMEAQEKTLARFDPKTNSDEEDVTNVNDLYESMTTIGYVPIDRIVVVPVLDTEKYLVIEGNRRVATIKIIRQHLQNGEGAFTNRKKRDAAESYTDSFERINCMLLDVEGLSDEERAHKISVVLGLRHHGSLLEWEPLPKAFNIFREYMSLEPRSAEFSLNNEKIKTVSSALSIKRSQVMQSLKTYIVYRQLSDHFAVKDHHYSLIMAGVTNKNLSSLLRMDDSTFLLDEPSIERMNTVCQFDIRDAMPQGKKKIVEDPKGFGRLGQIYKISKSTDDDAVKKHADDLLESVLDEEYDLTIEEALDRLVNMQKRRRWAETVNQLLDRLESSDLKLDDYNGVGNDRGRKDELKNRLKRLMKIQEFD